MEYIPLLIMSVAMVTTFTPEPLVEESKFFASRTSYEVIRAKSLKEEDIPGMGCPWSVSGTSSMLTGSEISLSYVNNAMSLTLSGNPNGESHVALFT